MKIKISAIPAHGLQISENISLDALNARMHEGSPTEISFTVAPLVEVSATRTLSGAETKGHVTARYRQDCAMCLENVEREVRVEANFVLKPKPTAAKGVHGDAKYSDDIGVIYYEDDYIDLEDVIQETLILSLSLYWHPEVDCEGRCMVCGKDPHTLQILDEPKSESQNFGALLKKAGVEKKARRED